MIRSFRSRALRRVWEKSDARSLNSLHLSRIEYVLDLLEEASSPEMLNIPGLHFHKLSGGESVRWSLRVSANRRITFSFEGEDAIEVDYEDYH